MYVACCGSRSKDMLVNFTSLGVGLTEKLRRRVSCDVFTVARGQNLLQEKPYKNGAFK